MKKDTLYKKKKIPVQKGSFSFNEEVASMFSDMVRRSIPGYDDQQQYIARYVSRYISHSRVAHPIIIDYGCSIGTTFSVFTEHAKKKNIALSRVKAILSDYSRAMLESCKKTTKKDVSHFSNVEYVLCDLKKKKERKNMSHKVNVGILHFVLQFLPPSKRNEVLHDIWSAIASPGLLIVSEKLCSTSPYTQEVWDDMYECFKSKNGYSPGEISAKRRALKGILVPSTDVDLVQMFSSVTKNMRHCKVDNFFSWGPFHCFALHKL